MDDLPSSLLRSFAETSDIDDLIDLCDDDPSTSFLLRLFFWWWPF